MLLWLAHWLMQYHSGFRVVQYVSFRSILSALTALVIALTTSPSLIRNLTQRQIGQSVRQEGPKTHLQKTGTPTMGGALILVAMTISVLLWADLSNQYIWLLMFVLMSYGIIGWVDDYRKVICRNSHGLPGRWKLFWQSIVALLVAGYLYWGSPAYGQTQIILPFLKTMMPNLGALYIILVYFVIVGSSNAVNLTDGLDGLALMPTILIAAALGVFAYLTGNHVFAHYLQIPYVPNVSEVVLFCSAMAGAGLGFLWFNTYPAQIFMGDVGALALGGALGLTAVLVRQEVVFFVMGGIFVAETVSVILQVASFKLTGRRIFKMAPLHHHFELAGWPEPKVIVRFWIITVILVLLGLATLKLR